MITLDKDTFDIEMIENNDEKPVKIKKIYKIAKKIIESRLRGEAGEC